MNQLIDRIAQAIGDPGSVVGRKLGPSWGVGSDGYAEQEETVTRWSTRAVMAVLGAQAAAEERAHGQTIDERDRAEVMADRLVEAIAIITGVQMGEHSNMNDPWENALQAATEYAETRRPGIPVAV